MRKSIKHFYLLYQICLSVLILVGNTNISYGQSEWEWLSRLPMSKDLYSVAYGNGHFVAVGAQGALLTSSDGIDWKNKDINFPRYYECGTILDLLNVVFLKSRFFAIGASLLISEDADNWTISDSCKLIQKSGDTVKCAWDLISLASNDSLLVGVCGSGTILTSLDGLIWTQVVTQDQWNTYPFGYLRFHSIAYGQNKFVAIAATSYPEYNTVFLNSANGINWSISDTILGNRPWWITYGNSRFVAVGERGLVMNSLDGSDWTIDTVDSNCELHSVNYIDNKFIAVGYRFGASPLNSKIIISSDGTSWTQIDSVYDDLYSTAYGNGKYVTVGQAGMIKTSSDANSWTTITTGVNNNLYSLSFGNSKLVAIGADPEMLLSSSDGIIWTEFKLSKDIVNYGPLCFGNNQFVLLTDSLNGNDDMKSACYTSTDGVTWIKQPTDNDSNFRPYYKPWMIAYGNGRYCGLGPDSSQIVACPWDPPNWTTCSKITYCDFSSSDGISWTKGQLKLFTGINSLLPSFTYCNGLFIILGDSGTLVTSPDGTTWTHHTLDTKDYLGKIAYGDSLFILWTCPLNSSDTQTIFTSKNGTSWEKHLIHEQCLINPPSAMAYGNGLFVGIGSHIYSSSDGLNWLNKDLKIAYGFNSLVFAYNRFIAVGYNGMIIGSDNGQKWSLYHLRDQNINPTKSLRNPDEYLNGKLFQNTKELIAQLKIANTMHLSRLPNSFAGSQYTIEIFNATGRRLFSKSVSNFNQPITISSSAIPSGTYILSIKNAIKTGVYSRMVITKY